MPLWSDPEELCGPRQRELGRALFEELGFARYLALFDCELPLLPRHRLRPLSAEEGTRHFAELCALDAQVDAGSLRLDEALHCCAGLPALENVLLCLEEGTLDAYHLYGLARFVEGEAQLGAIEQSCPLPEAGRAACAAIGRALAERTEENGAALRLDPTASTLKEQLVAAERALALALAAYEAEITAATGLRMIYPFGRELESGTEEHRRACATPLLTVAPGEGVVQVSYRLPDALEAQRTRKRDAETALAEATRRILGEANLALAPMAAALTDHYRARQRRAFCYVLLRAKRAHALCLPTLRADGGCELDGAVLPALAESRQQSYVPLGMTLGPGVTLLYGANLTGKTTVLKSLFFTLTLVRLGLPVPAARARLSFPEQVEIFLPTAGSLTEGLSGFGAELDFFSRPFRPGCYVFVDELFQSTNPVGGRELAAIVLAELARGEAVFFCTTHYPELLALPGVSLLRMGEGTVAAPPAEPLTPAGFVGSKPFTPVRVGAAEATSAAEALAPLRVALRFPLPGRIAEEIRKRLGEGTSGTGADPRRGGRC